MDEEEPLTALYQPLGEDGPRGNQTFELADTDSGRRRIGVPWSAAAVYLRSCPAIARAMATLPCSGRAKASKVTCWCFPRRRTFIPRLILCLGRRDRDPAHQNRWTQRTGDDELAFGSSTPAAGFRRGLSLGRCYLHQPERR